MRPLTKWEHAPASVREKATAFAGLAEEFVGDAAFYDPPSVSCLVDAMRLFPLPMFKRRLHAIATRRASGSVVTNRS